MDDDRIILVRQDDEAGDSENVQEAKSPQPEIMECDLPASNILKHLKSLEEKYPWMLYIEDEDVVICQICEWGSRNPKVSEVYELQTSKDVHLVAGKLKDHQDISFHRQLVRKREKLSELCKHMYPLLKRFPQERLSMAGIVKTVTDKYGGQFPGPQERYGQIAFINFTIKCIANCIEEKSLNLLAESPYFSVITFLNGEYAIIRCLNIKGEVEEHLYCTRISYSGESLSCISYLRKRHVNMKKLVSYTVMCSDREHHFRNGILYQVPVRCPDFKLLVNWLEEESFMKELFQQFDLLIKLCKTYNDDFADFSEIDVLLAIEEPYSYPFVVSENLVNFFFENTKKFREIAHNIHRKTGSNEAYSFSVLDLQNHDVLLKCVHLLHKVYLVINAHTSKYNPDCAELIEFNNYVGAKLKKIPDPNSGEGTVLALVETFLDLVVRTRLSLGRNITDLLSRKLNTLTVEDIDILLSNFMEAYQGNNTHYLEKLHRLQSYLSLSQECSLLELLEGFDTKLEIQKDYADLYRLHQKIKILPGFPAKKEQSMFNVTALQRLLANKVDSSLQFPKTFIMLEGPSVEHLNIDLVLDAWSRRWREGPPCRFNVPNRIG